MGTTFEMRSGIAVLATVVVVGTLLGVTHGASTCFSINTYFSSAASPFCSVLVSEDTTVTAVVENSGTVGEAEDTTASGFYTKFTTFMDKYDCSLTYSAWTCDDCKTAYKTWVCSQYFPKCENSDPTQTVQPCLSLCQDVQRKCPPELGFSCPDESDGRDYSTDSTCNKYGLTITSPASVVTTSVAIMATIVVAILLA